MIVTVTPNPAEDVVYTANEFRPGRSFHARDAKRIPGGSGVTVSVILRQLGYESAAMGFLAGHSGAFIRDELLSQGITTNFVNIRGETRTNTFIHDGVDGPETMLYGVGPEVGKNMQERFFWKLDRLLLRASALYIGGSLPPGVSDDFFRRAVDAARRINIPVFVSAYGDPMENALEALPTVAKLDRRATTDARAISQSALDHIIEKVQKVFDDGVDWVIASYFNRSNIFCTTKGLFMGSIDLSRFRTSRSANAALMAGLIIAREEMMGVEETIRFAMACVQEAVWWPEMGVPGRAAVEASLSAVKVQKL